MSEIITQSDRPLTESPAFVYIAKLDSVKSRRVQTSALRQILKLIFQQEVEVSERDIFTFKWHELRRQHVVVIRAELSEDLSPRTVNRYLSALRGVLYECWTMDLIDSDTYAKATDIKNIKVDDAGVQKHFVTDAEFNAMLEVCYDEYAEGHPAGVRDMGMLIAMYLGALRRSEVIGLELKHYDSKDQRLDIMMGKGNKSRSVYIEKNGVKILDEWKRVRGNTEGRLFCPIGKNRVPALDKVLSSDSLYQMVIKREKQAGLVAEDGSVLFSPHDLRRTAITRALQSGAVDGLTVKNWAGHSSMDTTSKYDLRDDQEARRRLGDALRLPD